MAKASGMPSSGKKDQQHQKDEHCHSCVFSPFRLCVVTAQRLILGRKVGNIGLVQGDDLDHDADGAMMPHTGMMPYIYIMGISMP